MQTKYRDVTARTADSYRRFADLEARGVSPIYLDWASGVADDVVVMRLVSSLPRAKRQPALVFAAARFSGAPTGGYLEFRDWLIHHWARVWPVVLARSTQTNEAGRLAGILPALNRFDGPLALIEAGASAGLCLYPDRFSYRYDTGQDTVTLDPDAGPSRVVLPCTIDSRSIPDQLPEVVWRAGVDPHPIDASDPESRSWLTALTWPEQQVRRERLIAALDIVSADPPRLVRGDLVDTVAALVDEAPTDARVIVLHTAALCHLDPARRERFAERVRSMPRVTWISVEGEHVLPRVAERVTTPVGGRLILAVDEWPLALVGATGQSYEAL